jgi:hypothetical protein
MKQIDFSKTKKYREVSASLLEQLRSRGADVAFFRAVVEHYMELWVLSKRLETDIRDNGIAWEEVSGSGAAVRKNNPSIKDLATISRQMSAILKDLNLTTTDVGLEDDDGL